jgi:drug/metabolite transporter (DMT)-like permease
MTKGNRFLSSYMLSNVAGIIAIILWATNIAFSKSIMEKEGNFNAAIYIYLFSGLTSFVFLLLFFRKQEFFRKLRNLPVSYYAKTGIFFILSNSLLFIAVGMVHKNEELVIISILNYSWPILIYIFKIPLFRLPYKKSVFFTGILFSFTGILLASVQGYNRYEILGIISAGDDNLVAYSLALLNSVCWALYSNLTIKHKTEEDIAGIPVIFVFISLVFFTIQMIKGQLSTISLSSVFQNPELFYQVIGPTSAGYLFWYIAIKKGNRNLITSLSFFIPLLSVLVIGLKFRIVIGAAFWFAVILLISGSYLCYRAMRVSIILQEPSQDKIQGTSS